MTRVSWVVLENEHGRTLTGEDPARKPYWRYSVSQQRASFGRVTRHVWGVDGQVYERPNPRGDSFECLPDYSGFLLCERIDRPDNLLLLDARGEPRMRLGLPMDLIRRNRQGQDAQGGRFIERTMPRNDPVSGEPGELAVLAWVEPSGFHAFELDWRAGVFRWSHHLHYD